MDLLNLVKILQTVFGVGLVIFVHELGHFLAARRCGVRVEVFSLGFGPRLLSWTRGDTTYQVAAVPLGGYVKMAGEELEGEDCAPAPDELGAKSIGQRFLIFSGGVIMNMIFAIVVFPLILLVGVPLSDPVVGETAAGSPAWHAGLEPGTRVLKVGDRTIRDFNDIVQSAALSSGDTVALEVLPPGSETPERVVLEAKYNEDVGVRLIGITQRRQMSGDGYVLEVERGSPAHEAGLRSGDVLVGVTDAPDFLSVEEQLLWRASERGPVSLVVADGDATKEVTVEPVTEEFGEPMLGVSPVVQRVSDLLDTPLVEQSGLRKDDLLVAIGGEPFWGRDMLRLLLANEGRPLELTVRRGEQLVALEGPALDGAGLYDLARSIAFDDQATSNRVSVSKGGAAEAKGMRSGDVVDTIDGAAIEDFEDLRTYVGKVGEDEPVRIGVTRDYGLEEPEYLTFDVVLTPGERTQYGLAFRPSTYVYQEKNPVRAVQVGMIFCWNFLEDTWRTLRGIATQDVAGKNVGGIITIGVAAHSFADAGWAKLFFFLCILSVNLAFLNVLPIPLLDGGHLFFLLIEKLKGSPVSERVMGYSQLVGLVLILSLFVYVMHNDIQRWILR